MLELRGVFYIVGVLVSILGGAMLVPLGVELFLFNTGEWENFALSAAICFFSGVGLALANYPHGPTQLKLREAFLMTAASWTALTIFAAFPLYWSSLPISYIDAWFETVSGLTTTGATILTSLDTTPGGILLWRSILQWLGGIGILVMAMTVLPILHIGGMQLFHNEFSDRSEKILPHVSQIASAILSLYLLLTVLCFIAYSLAGMDRFDAICHTLTTVSTGGFSTHDQSIGYFDSVSIEFVTIFFTIIGGTTLMMYIRFWKGDFRTIRKNSQLKLFLAFLFSMIALVTFWRVAIDKIEWGESLRVAFFNVTSIMTTCGFTSDNYTLWSSFPVTLLFVLGTIGGCTGSTTGAIKIFRLQVLFAIARAHLRKLRRPYGVHLAQFEGQQVTDDIATSVLTFLTLYILCMVILALGLAACDLDMITCLSGSVAAIGNVGPGLGPIIGPGGDYASLNDPAKLLLMAGMIIGRLELLTILVLFLPSFWRD